MVRRILRGFPPVTAAVFILPVVVGLVGTWLPAFGYLPVLGQTSLTLAHWQFLFEHPSVPTATRHTLVSAWGSTLLSLLLALTILALTWRSRTLRWLRRSLSGLLAIPHAAFAIGIVALLAPSGWIIKLLSPDLTGWELPPGFSLVRDPMALSLMAVLTLKETPFVIFMALAALQQLQVEKSLRMARSLGYSEFMAWRRIIIPQLLPMLRLPLFAVLAYGISVVDMAMIVGPSAPGTLAVLVDRWFNHPDIFRRLPGSAGATLLLLITVVSLMLWWLLEKLWLTWSRRAWSSGQRHTALSWFARPAEGFSLLLIGSALAAFAVLILWSFAFRWGFPDALPESWSTRFWGRGWTRLEQPFWLTLWTGLAAAVIGLVLVVGCLEHEVTLRRRRPGYTGPKLFWLIYVPLIVPQIAFLFGIQVVLVWFNLDGRWLTLLWSHLMFVVPYLFLSLSGPYRSFDDRYARQAMLLRGNEWCPLWRVKWPMLLRPLCYVTALGFAVSLAQYLPTQYVGSGRFATLTTETVSIAGGGDRRLVGVYALIQWLLPMVIYTLALLVPAWFFRHRQGMKLQG
ncbi:MAG: hypothetical protein LAT62_09485 [Natronospirillum sp.]|uniref:ABC transporter permease n=1 Tax=Natronospirillum sp. TaxID=2812955 RepID=UPI0025E16E68|nr:ABC transporter permease subunit [Natronospirillum sp.]MCH8552157.1 hypothetical protein [Natronospirillum sp.]